MGRIYNLKNFENPSEDWIVRNQASEDGKIIGDSW
jgi:hypothetical protein